MRSRCGAHAQPFRQTTLPAPIGFGDREQIIRGAEIAEAVAALRPAVLHSMEVQCAGYACLRATELLETATPPWLVSNWGSDVFLYQKLAAHRSVLEAIARRMDGILNECERDHMIMRNLGFDGERHYVMPASGGIDFAEIPPLSSLAPASARRGILIKGYHGWAGRGQHILSALHLVARELRRYRIGVVLAGPDLAGSIWSLANRDGLEIVAEPWLPDHMEALQRVAEARFVVGIGISDGIGTSLLEAMAFGALPIVANTSCADEWVQNDRHGLIVGPHDIAALAAAIRTAATDDELVDAAARPNREMVERRWNRSINRGEALAIYAAMSKDVA